MSGVVGDVEERWIKGEGRGGSGIAWGKGEVKRDIRCQTEGTVRRCAPGGEEERSTYVDMVTGVKGVPSTPGERNWVGEVGREEAGSEVVKMGDGQYVNERIWKRVWTRPRQRI